jgi:rod shape determining protein RodA
MLKSVDWPLFFPLIGILTLSVLSIHSATSSDVGLSDQARSQLGFAGVCFGLALLLSRISLNTISRWSVLAYGLGVLALLAVLVVGPSISGSRRWLIFGGLRIQPSEFVKLALILVIARTMQHIQAYERVGLRRLLLPLMIMGIPAALILVEPDLGTSLIVLGIGVSLLLLCNVDKRLLIIGVVLAMISAPLMYQFGLKDYQKQRVMTFLDPNRDPQGSGYNALQSMIAIGSGQLMGKGYLKGTQSRLDFIPEQHTDFIFSAYAEEWGFLGVVLLLGLYVWLLSRVYVLASEGPTAFATLFCLGFCLALALQIFINVGMVSGLLPVVGTTLPFFSYGRSSLLANFVGLGICLSIKRQQRLFNREGV